MDFSISTANEVHMSYEVDVKTTRETGPTPQLRPFQSLAHLSPAPLEKRTLTQPPLIPGALAAIFATLATIGGFAAGMLNAPASWIVATLAMVLALVAGVTGFETPKFATGRPLVKASLIGPLTVTAGLLVDFASSLPEGYLRGALGAAAVICVGLAGVPLPRPASRQ